jgi:hypothetical protein
MFLEAIMDLRNGQLSYGGGTVTRRPCGALRKSKAPPDLEFIAVILF